MKKSLLPLLIFCLTFSIVRGQTYSEWFRQKKTQQSYLLQQIAGLQVYLDYAEKGYGIIKKGAQVISDIKSGDFKLHQLFFQSLNEYNPHLESPADQKIIVMSMETILQLKSNSLNLIRSSHQFSDSERAEYRELWSKITSKTTEMFEETALLSQDNRYNLNDDERLYRLDRIRKDLLMLSEYAHDLANNIQLSNNQRIHTARAIQNMHDFYY